MLIQVRRGTEASRTTFTPKLGEPIWTTDTQKLYVGDGVTPGGIAVDTTGGGGGAVLSVNSRTGAVTLTKADVGLSNVQNTDLTAAVAANTAKNSYPSADAAKLAGIAVGATANSPDSTLLNRANHTGSQAESTVTNLVADLAAKQATLVSGTTIKTINGTTLLGSGDIAISGGSSDATTSAKGIVQLAGDLAGTAALPTVPGLAGKEPTVTAGTSSQYYRGDKTMQTLTQDVVPDGTTNKAFTAANQTKLSGIATGATANSSDATLLSRANHTGTQTASTISDFSTAADARVTAANKKTDSMTTNRLLGRGTAATGAIEEITLGTNLSLSGTTLNATASGAAITVKDEGTNLTTALASLDFVGTGVTATNTGGAVTVTVAGGGGSGTVTSASVVSANGFAGSVATATTTPAITLSTSVTGVLKGNGTAISAATAGTDYSAGTSALATGIVKSTTATGALSIAVAGTDYALPNANTTGSAATLTTARTIAGVSFNGSANISLASTNLSDTASIALATNTLALTNKDVKSATNTFAAVTSTASSATPTPTGDSRENELYVTAATVGMTIAAPTGTPVNGNKLMIAIYTAAAQTLAFNAAFAPVGVILPTTTVAGKWVYITARYNSTATKWHVLAVAQEA